MKFLDSITIDQNGIDRSIELCHGDLTDVTADILVVSAIPGHYEPIRGTLIEALDQRGVSVKKLFVNKMVDLRESCSCWLSQPISGQPFRQILCFEPFKNGTPVDVVGDIFRSLVPFVCGKNPTNIVAMPLVSSGSVGWPVSEILPALFEAATQWMLHGLPLKRLLLVERNHDKVIEMKGAFGVLKHYYMKSSQPVHSSPRYDVFISYCQKNNEDADFLVQELMRINPRLRIFIDRSELQPGMAWQQKLYQSIDDCRKVVALYTPEYVLSKACQEEFNIARVLHRQGRQELLFPLYLYSVNDNLPPHMGEWQYLDVREGNRESISIACKNLVTKL